MMIKVTDSGSLQAEMSKFLEDLAKPTKVSVFPGRAQRQAVARQLKNFPLLHNFIGVIEVLAEVLCRGLVNRTICYYFWKEAATCLTLGRRPCVS